MGAPLEKIIRISINDIVPTLHEESFTLAAGKLDWLNICDLIGNAARLVERIKRILPNQYVAPDRAVKGIGTVFCMPGGESRASIITCG